MINEKIFFPINSMPANTKIISMPLDKNNLSAAKDILDAQCDTKSLQTKEGCEIMHKNVTVLNEKHNDSIIVKLFKLAGRIVRIFNKSLGEKLYNYYPDKLKSHNDVPGPNNNQNDKDKGKDKVVYAQSSTNTMKEIWNYDDSTIRTGTLKSPFGTFVNKSQEGTDNCSWLKGVCTNKSETVVPPTTIKTSFHIHGPSWGHKFENFHPPSTNFEPTLKAADHQYFIEKFEQKNGKNELNVLPCKSVFNDDPTAESLFEGAKTTMNYSFNREEGKEILGELDSYGNLLIKNRSNFNVFIMSAKETEAHQIYSNNYPGIIAYPGTYLCWLDDDQETGFFVTKR